jgi:hypothetical protein
MVIVAAPAFAGSNEDATAEALFIEGKGLMAAGKYAQACAKFAESQRLDGAVGTLLNLGECYEKNGQTASAWAAFRSAASLGRKDHQDEKERVARERAAAIESKLSRLSIVVSPEARAVNVEIKRDGVALLEASWGTSIPIDPGTHTVEATSPGKKPWTKAVLLPSAGGTVTVTVPALEGAGQSAGSAPSTAVQPTSTEPLASGQAPHSGGWQRPAAFVSGGVGVVGLVVGTVFGLKAKSKQSDSEAFCGPADLTICSQRGADLLDEGKKAATLSTVGFIVGGLGIVGGVVLYLTADSGSKNAGAGEAKSTFAVVPSAGRDSVGVLARGTF